MNIKLGEETINISSQWINKRHGHGYLNGVCLYNSKGKTHKDNNNILLEMVAKFLIEFKNKQAITNISILTVQSIGADLMDYIIGRVRENNKHVAHLFHSNGSCCNFSVEKKDSYTFIILELILEIREITDPYPIIGYTFARRIITLSEKVLNTDWSPFK